MASNIVEKIQLIDQTNLQTLSTMSYSSVPTFFSQPRRRLTNLVELDLSENLLREVPSEAWRHTGALMRLNLGANPIKLIRSGAFQQLKVN